LSLPAAAQPERHPQRRVDLPGLGADEGQSPEDAAWSETERSRLSAGPAGPPRCSRRRRVSYLWFI